MPDYEFSSQLIDFVTRLSNHSVEMMTTKGSTWSKVGKKTDSTLRVGSFRTRSHF
jgi:hypothetical protein